jgi:hypothetical protein
VKVIYLAGPFRGPTAWAIECNVRNAETWALEVARAGAMPLCPHTNTRFFHGEGDDRLWLDGTMELLRRCDAIVLVPGWGLSSGARAERDEAERLGLPVFEVSEWDVAQHAAESPQPTLPSLRAWLQDPDGKRATSETLLARL